jgi:hypothetical protein
MSNRAFLIGLDKPTAVQAAAVHEQHRLESVAEMLGLVGVLTAKKVLTGFEIVTAEGAVYQWGEGIKADQTVGAHCLPGQLFFNRHHLNSTAEWTPQLLAAHGLKPLPLDSKLRNVAARTDVVPGIVNETDSLLEKMSAGRGLKTRFANAARLLLERGRGQSSADFAGLLGSAMDYYRLGAALICEERLHWLQTQARIETGPHQERRARQLGVVQEYLRILQDRQFTPHFMTLAGIGELLRDVVQPPNQSR